MPQIKKQDIQARLFGSAKKEFLKHGFHQASLRTIAKLAEMSLANVYCYAQDKDDLFKKVLSRVISDIDGVERHFKNYQPAGDDFDTLEVEKGRMKAGISYIYKNRTELTLLLNRSAGSSLEGYPEKIVEGYADNCKRLLEYLQKQNPRIKFNKPSDFFFKGVARFALKAVAEMLKQRLSLQEMEEIADEIAAYNFHGFRGMAEVSYKK